VIHDTDWTWNGREVDIIKIGLCLTLIEYRHIFRNLGLWHNGRQFRVSTTDLELENGRDLR